MYVNESQIPLPRGLLYLQRFSNTPLQYATDHTAQSMRLNTINTLSAFSRDDPHRISMPKKRATDAEKADEITFGMAFRSVSLSKRNGSTFLTASVEDQDRRLWVHASSGRVRMNSLRRR
jgi:hypothetical protein